jgi:hypothetical protein
LRGLFEVLLLLIEALGGDEAFAKVAAIDFVTVLEIAPEG